MVLRACWTSINDRIKMTQTADFIIVGGGVTGLLSALFLQELTGAKVVLLERHYMGSGQLISYIYVWEMLMLIF